MRHLAVITSILLLVMIVAVAAKNVSRETDVSRETLEVRLINGVPVDPVDSRWHPVVKIRSASGSGCTGTVVGPKVLLTAAHCGSMNEAGSFVYKTVEYNFTYTRSWNSDESAS